MRSASRTVERRWAMIRVVRPVDARSSASITVLSAAASRPLVGSSRIRMGAFRSTARAIAIRCFCPPERVVARSETGVS